MWLMDLLLCALNNSVVHPHFKGHKSTWPQAVFNILPPPAKHLPYAPHSHQTQFYLLPHNLSHYNSYIHVFPSIMWRNMLSQSSLCNQCNTLHPPFCSWSPIVALSYLTFLSLLQPSSSSNLLSSNWILHSPLHTSCNVLPPSDYCVTNANESNRAMKNTTLNPTQAILPPSSFLLCSGSEHAVWLMSETLRVSIVAVQGFIYLYPVLLV
jgi:hypothetical protein